MSILLKNGLILTLDEENKIIKEGNLFIEGDKIKGMAEELADWEQKADKIIDCRGMMIMPGLINSHSHSYAAYLKGTTDSIPGDIYMLYAIAGGTERTSRDIYICTMLDSIEQIRCGNTTVIDHFSQRPKQVMEGLDATIQAYIDIGMRAMVAPMFADKRYYETIPAKTGKWPSWLMEQLNKAPEPSLEEYYNFCLAAVEKWHRKHNRIKMTLGTDAPQRCSEKLLLMTADLMEKTGVGLHTHVLESKSQAVQAMDKYKMTMIEYMDNFNLLTPQSVLVHLVWLTDNDIKICANRGVKMVHSPNAMLVGSGITPLRKYLENGISVGLGTEGGSAGNMSLFQAMRIVALMQHVVEPDYDRWITCSEALSMATRGGAAAYHSETDLGSLEIGKQADLLVLDLNTTGLKPLGNPVNQLVLNELGSSLRHVIIGGEVVMEDNKLININEDEILAEAEEISKRIKMESNDSLKLVQEQIPYFRETYYDAMKKDIGINRFAVQFEKYNGRV